MQSKPGSNARALTIVFMLEACCLLHRCRSGLIQVVQCQHSIYTLALPASNAGSVHQKSDPVYMCLMLQVGADCFLKGYAVHAQVT